MAVAQVDAASAEILSPRGPIGRIDQSAVLRCDVRHAEWITNIFDLCETYAAVDGALFGPGQSTQVPAASPFGVENQSGPTGTGSQDNAYRLSTEVRAGNTGVRIVSADSYVEGASTYATDVELRNRSSDSRTVRLYRTGVCYTRYPSNPYNWSYGGYDGDPVGPFCAASFGAMKTRLSSTAGVSSYFEGAASRLHAAVNAMQRLPNSCEYCEDPAAPANSFSQSAGLSWDVVLAPSSTAHISYATTLQAKPANPVPTTLRSDPENAVMGGSVTYTLSGGFRAPGIGAAPDRAVVRVPVDGAYVTGSGSGVLAAAPLRIGDLLVFTMQRGSEGSFKVRYSIPGQKTVDVGIDSETAIYSRHPDSSRVYVRDPNASQPPAAPVITNPGEGASVAPGALEVRWTEVPQATEYTVLLDDAVVGIAKTTSAEIDVDRGDHTLEVVASNTSGVGRSAIRRFAAIGANGSASGGNAGTGNATASAARTQWVDYAELANTYLPVFEVRNYNDYVDSDGKKRLGEKEEGFWPVSFETVFDLRDGSRRTCRRKGDACAAVSLSDLRTSAGKDEFLDFPAEQGRPDEQRAVFRRALKNMGPTQGTSVVYAYVGQGRANKGSISLQYWTFYAYNHLAKNGDHEGDWEHASVILRGTPDHRKRRIKNPRPVAVFYASHDEGKALDWGDDELDRIGDGGRCDGRPDRNPAASHRWACVYVAQGSHAAYWRPGKNARRGLPDDHLATRFDLRWHLHRALGVRGLVGKSWPCWKGRAGDETSWLQQRVRVNPPKMPLRQQDKYGPTDPCSGVRAAQSALSDARTDLEVVSGCDGWGVGGHSPGFTSVVLCDPGLLKAALDGSDPAETDLLSIVRPGTDDRALLVATDHRPTSSLSTASLRSRRPSSPLILVATLRRDGVLEDIKLGPISFTNLTHVHLERSSDGSVSAVDENGTVLASARPTLSPTGSSIVYRCRVTSVTARRRKGLLKVTWRTAGRSSAVRYLVEARAKTGRWRIVARASGGRARYKVSRRTSSLSAARVITVRDGVRIEGPSMVVRGG